MRQFRIDYTTREEGAICLMDQTLWDLAQISVMDSLDIDQAANIPVGESFGGLTYTIIRLPDVDY